MGLFDKKPKPYRMTAKTKDGDLINEADFETKEQADKLAKFYRDEGARATVKKIL